MANAVGWEHIIAGQFLQGVIAPFTNIIGDFFWAFLIFMAMMVIYLKTQDFTIAGIIGILISTSAANVLPVQTQWIGNVSIFLAIAIILYKLFL